MKHYQWKMLLILFALLNAVRNLQFVQKDCLQRAKLKNLTQMQFLGSNKNQISFVIQTL